MTHVQYETASVLRYIEDNFGLAQLAASDTRANDPANDPASSTTRRRRASSAKIPGSRSRTQYWLR